jgi:hypothetical protein
MLVQSTNVLHLHAVVHHHAANQNDFALHTGLPLCSFLRWEARSQSHPRQALYRPHHCLSKARCRGYKHCRHRRVVSVRQEVRMPFAGANEGSREAQGIEDVTALSLLM